MEDEHHDVRRLPLAEEEEAQPVMLLLPDEQVRCCSCCSNSFSTTCNATPHIDTLPIELIQELLLVVEAPAVEALPEEDPIYVAMSIQVLGLTNATEANNTAN